MLDDSEEFEIRRKGQDATTWDGRDNDWSNFPEKKLALWTRVIGGDGMPDHATVSVIRYGPGCVVEPHYHNVDYCSIVVEGEIEVTRKLQGVGHMRFVRANTAYGPLRAGPAGCTVIDIFACDDTSVPIETHYLGKD